MADFEKSGLFLIAENANVFFGDMEKASRAVDAFSSTTDKAAGGVGAAGQVMIGMARKVGEVFVDLGIQADKAFAGFVTDSIDAAGDFEQTLNILQATSGATTQEMDAIAKKAVELGGDLSLPATSATDAGEAMLELSKAGFTATQSMDAAKGVLQLAAAAQIDEAKAAEISANAINAFGLQASDAIFVSDLLAASANASSVEITDVAQSYQMAGAIFSNFQGPVVGSKQAIIELTTAVGLLGNAGIKGSDAGTSLKQALLQLTGPSKKSKKLMGELAASIGETGDIAYDAQGRMRSFPEILGLTARATANMTQEQKNAAITQIFGADAARAILILMKEGPDAWDKMTAAVTRQGAAQDLAAARMKGLKGTIAGVQSQVETFQLALGTVLAPVLDKLLNAYVVPIVGKLADFGSKIAFATDPALSLAGALHQWSAPLGSIAFYLVELVRGGEGVSAWLKETPPLFQGFVGVLQTVRDKIAQFSTAFQAGGFAGLAQTILADLNVVRDRFVAWVQEQAPIWGAQLLALSERLGGWALAAIPPLLTNLANLRERLFAWVTESLPGWLTALGAFASKAGDWVLDAIPGLLANLGTFAQRMIDQTLTYVPQWATTLTQFGVAAVSWIAERLPQLAENLGLFLNQMANWVVDSLPRWAENVRLFGEKAITWVLDALPGLGTNLGLMTGKLLSWAIQTAADVVPKLAVLAVKFVSWVATDVIPALPGALLKIATGIYNFVAALASQVVPKLAEVGKKFYDWVNTTVIPKLPGVLQEIRTALNAWVSSTITWAGSALKNVGSAIVNAIKSGFETAWSGFVDSARRKLDEFRAMLPFSEPKDASSPLYGLGKAGESIVTMLAEGMGQTSALLDQARLLGAQMVAQFGADGKTAAQALADSITNALDFRASVPRALDSMDQFLADLRDDLTRQPVDIISAVFGNRGRDDLLSQLQAQTSDVFSQAQQIAGFDPEAAQQFLQLRTDQIQELADLQEQLMNASGPEAAALQQRIARIGEAQQLEFQSFLSQIDASGAFADLLRGLVSPPASASQVMNIPQSGGNSMTNNYNLGVQTNQSPAAVYQSFTTMQAMYGRGA